MKTLQKSAGRIPERRVPLPRPRPRRGVLAEHKLLRRALDAMSEFVFVLDEERKVLFCNQAVRSREGWCEDDIESCGLRLGDLLGCVYAVEGKGGCGTAEACRQCTARQAFELRASHPGEERECRMLTRREQRVGALDLRLEAVPFEVDGRRLTLLTATDIGPDKRRQLLERVFFHDVLNSVTSVYGLCCLLKSQGCAQRGELIEEVVVAAERLVAEIRSHQRLQAAEAGELTPDLRPIRSLAFLHRTVLPLRTAAAAEGRRMRVHDRAVDVEFQTDPVLLGRVLGNMLKNALEATEWGGTISVGCHLVEGELQFWVHNPGYVAREVQLQLFHRSFSTKAADRGLGTYSIKLLTENHLGGRVLFSSDPEGGTTFTVCLSLNQEGHDSDA